MGPWELNQENLKGEEGGLPPLFSVGSRERKSGGKPAFTQRLLHLRVYICRVPFLGHCLFAAALSNQASIGFISRDSQFARGSFECCAMVQTFDLQWGDQRSNTDNSVILRKL